MDARRAPPGRLRIRTAELASASRCRPRGAPRTRRKNRSMNIKLEDLKKLIAALEEGKVSEFEYEDEGSRLRLSFGAPAGVQVVAPVAAALAPASAPAAAAAPAVDDANVAYVTSPFVGTFYRAPSPEAASFADVGQAIRPGQVLCIVEAMKLMTEIESDVAGTILEVLVENGTSVEFGQKLFKVRKS